MFPQHGEQTIQISQKRMMSSFIQQTLQTYKFAKTCTTTTHTPAKTPGKYPKHKHHQDLYLYKINQQLLSTEK
jgi:hypothetical protein